jgi:ABC-type glycerol-3-phosphate transport system substrate-binding protein
MGTRKRGGQILVVAAASAACAASLLVGTETAASAASSSPIAKQITVWEGDYPQGIYQASHLEAFTKQTGIKVNYVLIPDASLIDKEEIAQRAHSSAFAMFMEPTTLFFEANSLMGGGVPLKPLIDNPALTPKSWDFSDISQGAMGGCTLNGKIYCLPYSTDGGVIEYNTKLFAKAGISAMPTTWQSVLADMNTITTKTGVPGWCTAASEAGAAIARTNWILQDFIPWNPNNKGAWVSPTWHALLDSPGAVQAYTLFQQLETKDAPIGAADFSDANCITLFEEGKVATDFDSMGDYSSALLNPPVGSPIHNAVGFWTVPCPTSKPCEVSGGDALYLNPNATVAQQNAAWLFMEYTESKPYILSELKADLPDTAVRTSLSLSSIPGLPASFVKAEAYVGSHVEPNSYPPTAAFFSAISDYEVAISDIAAGTSVTKELAFANEGADQAFKQAGLLK